MKRLPKHISKIVERDNVAPPWPRMILCGFAVFIPLTLGYIRAELGVAIYGALAGYMMALNDHLGETKNRLSVVTITFFLLTMGFSIGYHFQGQNIVFSIILAVVTYWLGLEGGEGAELERGVMLATLSMVILYFAKNLNLDAFKPLLTYTLVALSCILLGILTLNLLSPRRAETFATLRQSLFASFSLRKEKHVYAVTYMTCSLFAFWLATNFGIQRGYWIVVTVLLVMRLDRTQSTYVTLQRLIGTALAVLVCSALLPQTYYPIGLILLTSISAFFVPIWLKRNYLYASFFVTIFVLLLLEIAATHHGDTSLAFIRLRATLIGCSISLIGTLLSKLITLGVYKARAPR